MRYLKNLICLALIANLLLLVGCSGKPSSPLEEATTLEKGLLDNFKRTADLDYELNATTRITEKTFWIYIATEEDLVQISAVSGMSGFMPEKIIKFLDIKCQYEASSFGTSYIFLKFSPEERAKQQDLLQKTIGGSSLYQDFTSNTLEILQKVYFAIGDIIHDTEDFNFFAICLANIKKGIKITFIIHRLDMEQFLTSMLPPDEFYSRMILKTDGSKELIEDKYGISINYTDISLTDFLEEQIVNNVRSKLSEMEKFNPKELDAIDKLEDRILESIYKVTTKYEFDNYILVEVENIIDRERLSLSRSKLLKKFDPVSPSYSPELSGKPQ
ncbi:hypothetical protein ACFL2J_03275 [Candidatus Omnitrophota bacterium]